jgi:hypothetical protein
MPDFSNMTEEEQIAFAMQMSMQEARKYLYLGSKKKTSFNQSFSLQRSPYLSKLNDPRKRKLPWKLMRITMKLSPIQHFFR